MYTAGQGASLVGTWMQTVALGWLVLQLTGSGTSVGLVTAAQYLPVTLLAPLGGVLIDRLDTRRLLLCTQAISALLALTLGTLTITGDIRLWMVYVIACAGGVVQVVDNPARQLFSLQLVGPEHLTNAITLNTVTMNLARVVGPAIGAVIISTAGVGPCFIVNASSYVFVIGALAMMRASEFYPKARSPRAKGQVREGFRYVNRTPGLRTPLIMMALIGTLAFEFQVSLLLAAKYTFHGAGGTYGLMTSAMGIGAVAGGLLTASRTPWSRRHRAGERPVRRADLGRGRGPELAAGLGGAGVHGCAEHRVRLASQRHAATRLGSRDAGTSDGAVVGRLHGQHPGRRSDHRLDRRARRSAMGLGDRRPACLAAAAYGLRQQRRALEPAGEPWIAASARIA